MRRAFLAFLLWALAGHLHAEPAPASPAAVRVLFVGNSLVARTDVPGRLAHLARAMGRSVRVEAVTANDFSLEDHWRDARAAERIREGWDFVVLQQGPSSRRDSRALLIDYARRFAERIRATGARPAIFMAWPSRSRLRDFPEAMRSHRLAAEAVDGVLIPVAEAWLRVMDADKRLDLYADGLHASVIGGNLAVLACWFALFPAGPQEFDEAYAARIGAALGLPGASRDALLDAATRAIDEPVVLE